MNTDRGLGQQSVEVLDTLRLQNLNGNLALVF